MQLLRVGVVATLAACTGPGAAASSAAPSSLSSVLPPAEGLPSCVRGKEAAREQWDCGMTANPYRSGQREFVTCMVDDVLRPATQQAVTAEQVREALIALYDVPGTNIYVMGFDFTATAQAQAAAAVWDARVEEMARSMGEVERTNNPRPAVLNAGSLMVVVGCNVRGEPACCNEMTAAVKRHWTEGPGAAAAPR